MRLPTTARLLAATQCAAGAALIARPHGPLVPAGSAPTWLVRLLGARLALQGAGTALVPTRATVLAGGTVDALHGASMLAVVAAGGRHRRPAALSAALALVSAGASWRIAHPDHRD